MKQKGETHIYIVIWALVVLVAVYLLANAVMEWSHHPRKLSKITGLHSIDICLHGVVHEVFYTKDYTDPVSVIVKLHPGKDGQAELTTCK